MKVRIGPAADELVGGTGGKTFGNVDQVCIEIANGELRISQEDPNTLRVQATTHGYFRGLDIVPMSRNVITLSLL